ncbi:MAG: hypothetical protein Q8Q35_01605 [Nanoarchaeota archaeon]|nr:hypothetical protein [Nanoarchaeota archaeon]
MKQAIVLLLLVAVVISGCSNGYTSSDDVMEDDVVVDNNNGDVMEDKVTGSVTETKVLVDKSKYVSGGTDFDTAYQYFLLDAGKGYRITIESDKQVEVDFMTEENCALREKEQEYEIVSTKQGLNVVFEGNPVDERTNNCVFIKALENGQITSHVLVDELSF